MHRTSHLAVLFFLLVGFAGVTRTVDAGQEKTFAYPGSWSPVDIIEEGISTADRPQSYSAEIIIPLISNYEVVAEAEQISDQFGNSETVDLKVALPFPAKAYAVGSDVDIEAYLNNIELALGKISLPGQTTANGHGKGGNPSLESFPPGPGCSGYGAGTRIIDSRCIAGVGIVQNTFECMNVGGQLGWVLVDSRIIYSPTCDPNN